MTEAAAVTEGPAVMLHAADATPRFAIALPPLARTAAASSRLTGQTSDVADADAILAESGVTVRARLIAAASAAYPPNARSQEIEADVAAEIVVDTLGRVTAVTLQRRVGQGFDEAATQALYRYQFAPAERAGRKVRVRMPWVVRFRLN